MPRYRVAWWRRLLNLLAQLWGLAVLVACVLLVLLGLSGLMGL